MHWRYEYWLVNASHLCSSQDADVLAIPGTAWEAFMGGVDKKASFELLDYFWEAGGNFIDTANSTFNSSSELSILCDCLPMANL